MDQSTTQFLKDVRLRGAIPTGRYTNDEVLREGDLAIAEDTVPTVAEVRQDFWTTTTSIPVVAGQREYRLPSRAIGSTNRDVWIEDREGNTHTLPPVDHVYGRELQDASFYNYGVFGGYFLRGELLTLATSVDQANGETIWIAYERRPGRLVTTSDCARVTAVSGAVLKCASVPSGFATSTPLDIVQALPGFDVLSASASPTDVTTGGAGNITFASAVTDVAVGDFACLATESPIVQVPVEAYPLAVQATVSRLLEAEGDMQAAALARQNLEMARERIVRLLTPRRRGSAQKIVNRNSPLRRHNRFYR